MHWWGSCILCEGLCFALVSCSQGDIDVMQFVDWMNFITLALYSHQYDFVAAAALGWGLSSTIEEVVWWHNQSIEIKGRLPGPLNQSPLDRFAPGAMTYSPLILSLPPPFLLSHYLFLALLPVAFYSLSLFSLLPLSSIVWESQAWPRRMRQCSLSINQAALYPGGTAGWIGCL